jgi:hypothetical protein
MTPSGWQVTQARVDGFHDHQAGVPLDRNPYRRDHDDLFRAWRVRWLNAKDQREAGQDGHERHDMDSLRLRAARRAAVCNLV